MPRARYRITLFGLDTEHFPYATEAAMRAGWYRLMVAACCEVRKQDPILGMTRRLRSSAGDRVTIDKRFAAWNPAFDDAYKARIYFGDLDDEAALCRLLDAWKQTHTSAGQPTAEHHPPLMQGADGGGTQP